MGVRLHQIQQHFCATEGFAYTWYSWKGLTLVVFDSVRAGTLSPRGPAGGCTVVPSQSHASGSLPLQKLEKYLLGAYYMRGTVGDGK